MTKHTISLDDDELELVIKQLQQQATDMRIAMKYVLGEFSITAWRRMCSIEALLRKLRDQRGADNADLSTAPRTFVPLATPFLEYARRKHV